MIRVTTALALIGALHAVVAPAGRIHAQEPQAASLERRVDSLFASYTRGATPGVAIAVVRDGRMLLSKGYGLASLEHRVPITPTTVFDVASVSKQFTGLAVAMLVEQGRVKLTDDIRKYIPELGDVGHTITIDHLLHHTSGLRDWPGTLALAGWRMDDVISFDQIRNMAYHQRTLNFVPGAEYMYSNTGYNLLAEMVARVTGQSFPAWIDANFFRPLGMTHSRFRDDHTWVVPNRAFGYEKAADSTWAETTNNLEALGSSSLFSSAEDLARWVINFDDQKLGGPAAMAMTRTRGRLNDGSTIPYAFGISNGMYRGQKTVSHGGSWASFATYVLHFPDLHFGVVVLANSSINAARAANNLAEIYLGKELAPRPGPPNTFAGERTVEVPAAVLDRYVGLYRLGPGWYVRLRRDGGALRTQATREDEAPMSARSDTLFWVEAYNEPMILHAVAGQPTQLTYRGKPYLKLPESRPFSAARLKEFVGDYESDELQAGYRIEATDSGLVMRHPRHGTIALTWLWRDDFGGSAWFTRSVEFRRDATGKVVGFSVYVDDRSRDIRFTKRR
jgi:CubicO group peptidase (beta-lactamase class C family)